MTRVYILNKENFDVDITKFSDEIFTFEAEKIGKVLTINEFQDFFNECENISLLVIRIIEEEEQKWVGVELPTSDGFISVLIGLNLEDGGNSVEFCSNHDISFNPKNPWSDGTSIEVCDSDGTVFSSKHRLLTKNTYNYSVSSESIWGSFDNGTVEAYTNDEARELAIKELTESFEKVRLALEHADNTNGFTIEFSKDNVEVTLQS